MTKELAKEFGTIGRRLNDIEKRLSDFTEMLNQDAQSKIDFIAIQSDIDIWDKEDEPIMEEEG